MLNLIQVCRLRTPAFRRNWPAHLSDRWQMSVRAVRPRTALRTSSAKPARTMEPVVARTRGRGLSRRELGPFPRRAFGPSERTCIARVQKQQRHFEAIRRPHKSTSLHPSEPLRSDCRVKGPFDIQCIHSSRSLLELDCEGAREIPKRRFEVTATSATARFQQPLTRWIRPRIRRKPLLRIQAAASWKTRSRTCRKWHAAAVSSWVVLASISCGTAPSNLHRSLTRSFRCWSP